MCKKYLRIKSFTSHRKVFCAYEQIIPNFELHELQLWRTDGRLVVESASTSVTSRSATSLTRGANEVVTTLPEYGVISDGRRVLVFLFVLFDNFFFFQWEIKNSALNANTEMPIPKPKIRKAPETVSKVAVREGELDSLFIGRQPYFEVYSLVQRWIIPDSYRLSMLKAKITQNYIIVFVKRIRKN